SDAVMTACLVTSARRSARRTVSKRRCISRSPRWYPRSSRSNAAMASLPRLSRQGRVGLGNLTPAPGGHMPSRRAEIALTEEEQRQFLDEGWTLQVASIGPKGYPHLVAMWYVV